MLDHVGRPAEGADFAGACVRPATRRLPGVDGIWVLIGVDSVVFVLLFVSFMQARMADPQLFDDARVTLNRNLGGINTVILLTSSWAVALSVQALRDGSPVRAKRFLAGALVAGGAFVGFKLFEYVDKIGHGITPVTNDFYMWYFALTGIHLVHVLIGLGLLGYVFVGIRRGTYDRARLVVPECVASFWHLVDFLWVVLFPLVYLMEVAR